MPGYVNEPELAAERSRALVEQGYTAIKWFFRHHPAEGQDGFDRNLALIRQVRAAVGDEVDLMFDAWNAWNVDYTLRLIEAAAPYRPLWIEEPVLSHSLEAYATIREGMRVCKVAGGEHAYTRWGVKPWLEAGAVDILQPDPRWAGGLSEMQVICGVASTYGVAVVPHAAGHAATHLIASQPLTLCPMQEHAVRDTVTVQFFLRNKNLPIRGQIPVPQEPGLGIDLDTDVIESQETLEL
jgi:L-alanine-DL-glutamate epimerase-like enolase superfamily enzyme